MEFGAGETQVPTEQAGCCARNTPKEIWTTPTTRTGFVRKFSESIHQSLIFTHCTVFGIIIQTDTKMPLILHNVPDEERYVGDDGLTRPYAMLFGQYVSPCLPLRTASSLTIATTEMRAARPQTHARDEP